MGWDHLLPRESNSSQDIERHYRVYVPRRYDSANPTPLLFVLGGFSVDMYWLAEFVKRTDLQTVKTSLWCTVIQTGETLAATMYSRGMSTKMHLQGHGRDNPDIDYMENIIDEMGSLYNIDLSRIFVSGHLRGGALSIIAAFERPDLFAGYCAQAGFVGANDYDDRLFELASTAEHRVPGVLVHGEADPDVTVQESDRVAGILSGAGWTNNEDWLYIKIPNATHEWQTQYNQQVWDFSVSPSKPVGAAMILFLLSCGEPPFSHFRASKCG